MTEQERKEKDQEFDKSITMTNVQAGESGSVIDTTALATVESSPAKLLELAIQKDLDIDKLERLMVMKERWDAQKAKEAFYEALARFQKLVPTLIKDKHVKFKNRDGTWTEYSHASLGSIKNQIQEILADCGLSLRWEFDDKPDLLEVSCIITHVDGHSEQSSMNAPVDSSGGKNVIQGRQSTRTYLERATVIGGLGLMAADKDDDGRQGIVGDPTPEESAKDLPPVPEGTETKAPKPETAGKTDFEKRLQLKGYLFEITGIDPDKSPFSDEDKKKLSDELVELTRFDEKPDGEPSLKTLSGNWLNTAIGKAKAKLGIATSKDELLHLLDHPGLPTILNQGRIDEIRKGAEDKRHKEEWFKEHIDLVKAHIADIKQDKQGTLLT